MIDNYRAIKNKVERYTTAMVLPNTDERLKIPWSVKLSMIQITPKSAVKERKVWSQMIPYVTVWYVERALNFVTNFNRGIKIIDKWVKEELTSKWQTKYDAWVQCDCYAVIDWNRIERSVFGSRQMFGNPAVSSYAVYEAARSQATKSFADTLGIWSDKARAENEKIEKAREIIEAENIDDLTTDFSSWATQPKQSDQ